MNRFSILALLRNDSGATAIEYSLMTALVALSAIGGLMLSGDFLAEIFDAVADDMSMANASAEQ